MICLQGASATQQVLQAFIGRPVRVFIVWEPVLPTDWGAPSTTTLKRITDTRAAQFWDGGRLISHQLDEHGRRGIVWDYVAVYPVGASWNQQPPNPLYEGRPVVQVIEPLRNAITRALEGQ
jgi:hypothetical protein